MYRADTIVACATPPGRGAIAIVRLSGDDAFPIADQLVRPVASAPPVAWKLTRAIVVDGAGDPVDDALVVRMPGPRTYTGEDVVEIHCHGSALVVETVIAAVVGCGARAAEPGEFSRRAVLNGRMDLLQAEAVADLIDARVGAGARAAWEQLQGALSESVRTLRGRVVSVLADVEANVDFSDEELPSERVEARREPLGEVVAGIDSLLSGFAAARRRRDGHVVVFAGRPNVGKSSLVNALLGYGRMIVAEEAGTTRDTVEELVDLGGEAFVLTDTAGDRAAPGAAERVAVERARQSRERADIEVVVVDRSVPLGSDDRRVLERADAAMRIVVANKADLGDGLRAGDRAALGADAMRVLEASALSGEGCDELAAALLAAARELQPDEPVAISRIRHRSALEEARVPLLRAVELLADASAPELVAIELRAAMEKLAAITEPLDNEEVLDEIFAAFCIGK